LFFDLLKGYTSREGSSSSLACVTPLTGSNIKTAATLWVSNQASATSTYGLVHTWDLSQVTSLEKIWCGHDASYCGQAYMALRVFNGDLSMWDVSKVTTMKWTFLNAQAFNGDISKWDVSKVTILWGCKLIRIIENGLMRHEHAIVTGGISRVLGWWSRVM
jgi:surface protein